MDNLKRELTLGEKRVGVDFNVANRSDVTKVKIECAKSIDFMQSLRIDEDGLSASSEKQRLISTAQTAYEEAGMWAVKALTHEL
jgi:hypothetical protein